MSAFARGFTMGQTAYQQMLENKDREERRAREKEEFEWRRKDRTQLEEQRQREDAAFSALEAARLGLAPETQAQITQTYGMTPQQMAAAGTGLKEKLASYDTPDSWDLQNVPVQTTGLQAPGNASATAPAVAPVGVQRRFSADQVQFAQPSNLDVERALERVAVAKRDVNGIRTSMDNQRKLVTEEGRRAELKRLNSLSAEELAKEFGSIINPAESGVPAMVGYDDKTRKVVFASEIPGLPSRTLSRAEMVSGLIGMWEKGNGDYNVGVQAVLNTVKTNRDLEDKSFDRSARVAELNSTQDYRNRSLDNDTRRTNASIAASGRSGRDVREFVNEKNETVLLDVGGLKRNPDGSLQTPAGLRPKGAKNAAEFTQLPEDGTRVMDAKRNVLVYSNGRPILEGGAATPEQFGALSARAGVDQNLLEWGKSNGVSVHPYGRHLVYNDQMYDLADKNDVKAFNQLMQRQASARVAIDESERAVRTRGLATPGSANANAAATNRSVLENIRNNTER